jgi:ABC-2 type transport system ATP-binding protein
MTEPAIAVEDLAKRYGRTQALDGVSFAVARGEMFALLGPNGAGKSTLMHILCTLLRPDAGTARIGGVDVVTDPRGARRHLGVVFQEPSLDDRLTVWENLEFHGLVYGVPKKLRSQRIDAMLELVELGDWRESLVRRLSTGMKRRLEIARALIHEARILCLDEPTVGLDPASRERIWQYLTRLRDERGLTLIVTTHYIDEVDGCDRVCIIDHGKILASDSPTALKNAHGRAFLRIVARDDEAERVLLAQYGDKATRIGGDMLIETSGDAFNEAFLAAHATRIKRLSVEDPSLESVFLSLTGRELRDQAAGARERTYAFGKQGGEHTR